MAHQVMRRLRRRWRPPRGRWDASGSSLGAALARVGRSSLRLEAVLRGFYAFPPFWFVTHLEELAPLLAPRSPELLWPVAWLAPLGPERLGPLVLAFGLLAPLLAVLRPDLRVARVAVLVALLEVLALKYSFGKIHHLMHGWLYTAFLFAVFLPNEALRPREATREARASALLAFHAAQVMLALTYSLAGVGKLIGSVYQAALGQVTPLHPSALAVHIADRILQTHPPSLLGPFMIDHGVWMWPLMLGTLYLQTFAVVAAFRPRLHRIWGLGLIGFHVVTALSLTIDFTPNILLLGALFLASPFVDAEPEPRAMLRDLPGVGRLLRR